MINGQLTINNDQLLILNCSRKKLYYAACDTVTENNLSIISKDYDFAWFPCSSVGTRKSMSDQYIEKSMSYIKFGQTSYLKVEKYVIASLRPVGALLTPQRAKQGNLMGYNSL